eukprot:jgi/Mesvir1/1046/Mv26591-RA.1
MATFLARPSVALSGDISGLTLRPRHGVNILRASQPAPQGSKRCTTVAMASNRAKAAAAIGCAASIVPASAAFAAENVAQIAEVLGGDVTSTAAAIAGLGAAAAVAAVVTDPERRRKEMTEGAGGDEMKSVESYFNGDGFQRWKKIYGDTDDVNKVQLDIRIGHAQTVDKVLAWLSSENQIKGRTFCDAGCGTGSLSIPLAERGGLVDASDISVAMVTEAEARAKAALAGKAGVTLPMFSAKNLEDATGKFDTVVCLDVFIHYDQEKANQMVKHLASLAKGQLIISFAPKTTYYSILKRIGELFPGPSKATRAYLHAEADIEAALQAAGWKVKRREMTATKFYFSRLLEAIPA